MFASTYSTIVKNIHPVIKFGLNGNPEYSSDITNKQILETVVSQLFDFTQSLALSSRPVLVFFEDFQVTINSTLT